MPISTNSLPTALGTPGNTIVTLQNGTYSDNINDIFNSGTPSGPDNTNGWLVIVAQTQGGVHINCRQNLFELQQGSKKILFVGIAFDGQLTLNRTTDIRFWRCTFTFSLPDHHMDGATFHTQFPLYNAPRAVMAQSSTRMKFFGCEFHHVVASARVDASNTTTATTGFEMHGVWVHDIYPSDRSVPVIWHSGVISAEFGFTNYTITDFVFDGGLDGISQSGGGPDIESTRGSSTVTYNNGWMTGSSNDSFSFSASSPYTVNVTFNAGGATSIYSWNAKNGIDINVQSSGVTVTRSNFHASTAPPVGSGGVSIIGTATTYVRDPYTIWLTNHPYSTYTTDASMSDIFTTPVTQTLRSYIEQPGDVLITIPSGTTLTGGGDIDYDHPNNPSGKYEGWLILDGRGVTVDLRGSTTDVQAIFSPNTSRVLLIGFNFIGLPLCSGNNIIFWYCNFTFPLTDFQAAGVTTVYSSPDGLYLNNSIGCKVYGSTFQNCADYINASGAGSLWIQGCKGWNQISSGSFGNRSWSSDAVDIVGGNASVSVYDCFFQGGRFDIEDTNGAVIFDFQNIWTTTSETSGFVFKSAKTSDPRGVFGNRKNIYSWNHSSGHDRSEQIDANAVTYGQNVPNRIVSTDSSIVTTAPTGTDPATVWQTANPITSYNTFFTFITHTQPPINPPGSPTITSAIGGVGTATISWNAPSSDGGAPIASYTITASPSGKTKTVDGTTRSGTITGLSAGTYTFTVIATNSAGPSNPSNPSNAVNVTQPSGKAPPATGTIWKDTTGLSPKIIGWGDPDFLSPPGWTDTKVTSDFSLLNDYGSVSRFIIQWSKVYVPGSSVRTGTDTNFTRYDQEIHYALAAGVKKIIICIDDCPAYPEFGYANIGRSYPQRIYETRYNQWVTTCVNRYKPGNHLTGTTSSGAYNYLIPSDAVIIWEVWNEANDLRLGNLQPSVAEYAWLYDTTYRTIHTAIPDAFVGPSAPKASTTRFLTTDGSTDRGSDWFNQLTATPPAIVDPAVGFGTRAYSPIDWYRNLFYNINGCLQGSPTINNAFECLFMKGYWSSRGPMSDYDVSRSVIGVNYQHDLRYNDGGIRNIKNIYDDATSPLAVDASGNANDDSRCKIYLVEVGGTTVPYWNNVTQYNIGDPVYLNKGYADPGNTGRDTKLWVNSAGQYAQTRSTLYQCYKTPPVGISPINTSYWMPMKNAVDWNSTTAYPFGTFVNHYFGFSGTRFMAIRDVPAGVEPPNTTYWKQVDLYGLEDITKYAEEDEAGFYIDQLQKTWYGLQPDQDGQNIGESTGWIAYTNNRDEGLGIITGETIRETLMGAQASIFGSTAGGGSRTWEQEQWAIAANFANGIRIQYQMGTPTSPSSVKAYQYGDGVSCVEHVQDIVTKGHRRIIIQSFIPHPYLSHSTSNINWWWSTCDQAANDIDSTLNGLVGAGIIQNKNDVEIIWEMQNEPNHRGSGYDNVIEYAFWFKQYFLSIKQNHPNHTVITGGPSVEPRTNLPPSTPGSNIQNLTYSSSYNGGARSWAPLDWIFDLLDPTVVGTGNDLFSYTNTDGQYIDGIGIHIYMGWSAKGPFYLQGSTAGCNLTPGSAQNVNVNGNWRMLNRVQLKLTNIGTPANNTYIYVTESAAGTCQSWNSIKASSDGYPVNDYVYFDNTSTNQGTSGGATWNRPKIYQNTSGTINYSSPILGSSGNGWTYTGIDDQMGGSESVGTENEAGYNLKKVIQILTQQIPDVDGQYITKVKGWFLFQIVDANPYGYYGLFYRDGTEKGNPTTSGPYSQINTNVNLPDPRISSASVAGLKYGIRTNETNRIKGSTTSLGVYGMLRGNALRDDTRVTVIPPSTDPFFSDCSTLPDLGSAILTAGIAGVGNLTLSIESGKLHIENTTDVRGALWPNQRSEVDNAEVRSTFVDVSGAGQEGHVHRITNIGLLSLYGFTVSRNPSLTNIFDIHVMGPLVTGAGYSSGKLLNQITLNVDLANVYPLYFATRMVDNTIDIKAWPTTEDEPDWDGDPNRTGSYIVSTADMPTGIAIPDVGQHGWFFGHPITPDFIEYDDIAVRNSAGGGGGGGGGGTTKYVAFRGPSGYQSVTWDRGEPLRLDKIAKMVQNDYSFYNILRERPRGVQCILPFKSKQFQDVVNGITLTNSNQQLLSTNLHLNAGRFYLVEVMVDNIVNNIAGAIAEVAIYIEGLRKVGYFVQNTDRNKDNQYGGLYLPYIWTAPDNLKDDTIQFQVYGRSSIANGSFIVIDPPSGLGTCLFSVTDVGSVFRTEIT